MYNSIEQFMEYVQSKNPGENEVHQAVHEVTESLWDFLQNNPHYAYYKVLDRMV